LLSQGPADDFPGIQVHDSGKIEPAFLGIDIDDIGHPGLVGLICHKVAI
jgi:hypothetical protein